ncbi:hypothetical protein GCM10025768_20640 [Microbacterium pseudoresistens]|uniref:Murein DD-endopeptidase MepM/ murein hydrolase activator NlpD n=1 Tax=Microbacterium pseudoresistens TaxID=640634 RepID=A0A7Y9JLW0_9MICO|nr:M23 family metallopeptidase [Microbacterium pseudoresistens]NYD53361.1 murein DD-endopeptidase MepM/ murein hydrolase activator NlpD [Microbacterium pseudoresistens]
MAAEIDKTGTKTEELSPAPRSSGSKRSRSAVKPIRSIAIFGAVGALVTAIALPAFASGAAPQGAAATTMHQLAADNSQSVVVASEATAASSEREEFTATTPEEIEKAKAEAAAAARAASLAENSGGGWPAGLDLSMVSPGSGEVRWPLIPGSFTSGETPGAGRNHEGWDMLAPGGTPIYAAAAGYVRVSSENYGGYGVGIVIDHTIAGTPVTTVYGHMIYGSRMVSEGEYVQAGQMIGLVGETGHAFGTHLHFEVHINGGIVDPSVWLPANAG